MKQRIKQRTSCLVMAIGFIAALALSGCSKEGDTPADSNPGSEIRLTSGVQVQSRAATAPDHADSRWRTGGGLCGRGGKPGYAALWR